MTFRWIDTDRQLAELVDEIRPCTRLAVDTEFHRERTYFPRLALVQIAWSNDAGLSTALVDPLACDIGAIVDLFGPEREFVFHAAQQDLDVLSHAMGRVPERIFDTQLAAGFVGYSSPSLANLVNAELRRTLPKGDRLTDWLRRPLEEAQKQYAASDVEHLFEIQDRILERLHSLGRTEWAADACRELLTKKVGPADPTLAWTKLKDVRGLRPRTRGVLAAVAEWRERKAMAADVPVRQILPDLALQGIAQREPTTVEQLTRARGVDDRHTRGSVAQEILAAVRRGLDAPIEAPVAEGEELDRRLRPVVTLVSAWVSEVARREEIDPVLVATRSDIVDLLRGTDGARLSLGWRADLVGNDIADLVAGRTALAFDGRGGLRLVMVPDT